MPAVLHLLDRFQKNEALSLKQQTVLETRLNELEKKLNDAIRTAVGKSLGKKLVVA